MHGLGEWNLIKKVEFKYGDRYTVIPCEGYHSLYVELRDIAWLDTADINNAMVWNYSVDGGVNWQEDGINARTTYQYIQGNTEYVNWSESTPAKNQVPVFDWERVPNTEYFRGKMSRTYFYGIGSTATRIQADSKWHGYRDDTEVGMLSKNKGDSYLVIDDVSHIRFMCRRTKGLRSGGLWAYGRKTFYQEGW